ncbi:MAG: aminoacyl-tRNA hydrolase [Desulfovibrio sp.]|nr:aminoacyl-tRNA hydrolase [Desulfovibrio sp.]
MRGVIVGLGNPGREYEGTRHNFGCMALRALLAFAQQEGTAERISRIHDPYALWRCSLRAEETWLAAIPLTYMNASGEAVQRLVAYYHLGPEELLILHDELDLPLGRLRLKKGGGTAGHNGLKSIQQMLGTPDFYRLRMGIGKRAPAVEYVLSRFPPQEKDLAAAAVEGALRGILLYMEKGPEAARIFCHAFAVAPA